MSSKPALGSGSGIPEQSSFDDSPLGQLALIRAKELFITCDTEEKGFIIKRDMQRLEGDLELTPDQLEEVFDSLDSQRIGYLTMAEFIRGFSTFLGLQVDPEDLENITSTAAFKIAKRLSCAYPDGHLTHDGTDKCGATKHSLPNLDSTAACSSDAGADSSSKPNVSKKRLSLPGQKSFETVCLDEEEFDGLMETLGSSEVFAQQEDAIRGLWQRIRTDEPELLDNFRGFLTKISGQIQQTQAEFSQIENALQQNSHVRDTQIRQLYEEVEEQIKSEKIKIAHQEQEKAMSLKMELIKQLEEKDRELQDTLAKQMELERKVSEVSTARRLTEREKAEMEKEQSEIIRQKLKTEADLNATKEALQDANSQLDALRQKSKEEKRARMAQAIQVSEGIATEREELVKQLDELRIMNKQLKDARDENILRLQCPAVPPPIKKATPYHQPLQAKVLHGNYETAEPIRDSVVYSNATIGRATPLEVITDDGESDYEIDHRGAVIASLAHGTRHSQSLLSELQHASSQDDGQINPDLTPRKEPIGAYSPVKDISPSSKGGSIRNDFSDAPDRLFKVVFIGDSGVGKTCFLQRFCNDRFLPTFCATVGVDFQVRSLRINNRGVVLQLWDTAGQERFRSITKQYFRKADGVVVMYDVTSEASFLNIRNWMDSVKEGADPGCAIAIVGNKIDLVGGESTRIVKHDDGKRLADSVGAIFGEASAQNGTGVAETMHAIACLLSLREDQQLEKVLRLEMEIQKNGGAKKRGCCGGRK